MWVYFNKNGQLITSLEHGSPARVGSTDFSIFAVVEGIDETNITNYSGVIRFIKPDLRHTEYPVLLMNTASATFEKLEGEGHIEPFEDGKTYYGFLFDFDDFDSSSQEEYILLDTNGLWNAIITLISTNQSDDIYSVKGVCSFNVAGVGSEDATQIPYNVVTTQLVGAINQRALKSEVILVTNSSIDISSYGVGQMFYRADLNKLYELVLVEQEKELQEVPLQGNYEVASNKVNLGPTNTTLEYPNAKSVWDECKNIREVAEGKCNSFVFSDRFLAISGGVLWYLDEYGNEQHISPTKFMVYNSLTKEWKNKAIELYEGEYNGISIANRDFDSTNDVIDYSTAGTRKYLIIGYYGEFGLLNVADYDNGGAVSKFPIKVGDNFYVVETDVPDRWYVDRSFFKLETVFSTNIENGTGTNAVRQKMADATVNFTGRNPNAEALDPTLSATLNTGASGNQSSAFGKNTMALATASFANGNKTVAKGEESHAEGYQSVTLGDGSHAEGAQTVSAGLQSHSEGALTQALGDESHAEGHGTIAGALASHSEGSGTKVGNYSQESGIGADHTVSPTPGPSPTPPSYIAQPGEGSHVEGYDNIVSGYGSHAEGVRNYVTGNYSHAEGINNSLLKNYAHVSGYNNISNADCSETSGIWNINNGYGSFVTGYYNECSYNHQTIVGKFNLNKSDTLFEVGNGTADNVRSNAFEVHQDGRATIGAAPIDPLDVVNKGAIKTINGQSLVGTGNLQISVNQTGLFSHSITINTGDAMGILEFLIINNDSTPINSTNPTNLGDDLSYWFYNSVRMMYASGGRNLLMLLDLDWDSTTDILHLVYSYFDYNNYDSRTTVDHFSTSTVVAITDTVTAL